MFIDSGAMAEDEQLNFSGSGLSMALEEYWMFVAQIKRWNDRRHEM